MELQRFDNVQKFCHHVQDYLLQHEAEHNLFLGILHSLMHNPERYSEAAYLALVQTEGQILAAAVQTPPYKLVLSKARDLEAIAVIAQDLQADGTPLPGVSGLVAEVETFLRVWQTLTGQSYRRVMEMRIHQLTQVEFATAASGHLRLATEADRSMLLEWFAAFACEIGEVVSDTPAKVIDSGLKRQSIYLWDDRIPVSWASGSRSLPAAARIGPVYTPPNYRRKGYATACVAALSQRFLDQGCSRCYLFTDLANPTSNHIYQQIGYRPICDWHDYSFISKEQTGAHLGVRGD